MPRLMQQQQRDTLTLCWNCITCSKTHGEDAGFHCAASMWRDSKYAGAFFLDSASGPNRPTLHTGQAEQAPHCAVGFITLSCWL